MPKSLSTFLTFYPAYCFSLSAAYNSWAKLSAADVHLLREREGFEGQKIYFYLNHPIKWVRLVGIIVAFDEYPNRWILQLDDSSGSTIEVTCPRTVLPNVGTTVLGREETRLQSLQSKTILGNDIDMTGIDLGIVVKVKGGLNVFRGEKQITLERISIVRTTTEEVQAWSELHHFHESVLSKPWAVTTEQQQTLREEANGTKAIAEEKARRRAKKEAKEARRRRKVEGEAWRGKEKLKHEMDNRRGEDKNRHACHNKHKRRTSDKENQLLDDESNAPEGKTLHHRDSGKRRQD